MHWAEFQWDSASISACRGLDSRVQKEVISIQTHGAVGQSIGKAINVN